MKQLTDQQAAEYFRRSYTAVDGLWFMKLEEAYGFDEALRVDHEVWKVLPKIQARKLKTLLNGGDGLEGLQECLGSKLKLEEFQFEAQRDGTGLSLVISECPWHQLLAKSGRVHLADKISTLICQTEYSTWAAEFGGLRFEFVRRCQGSPGCQLRFRAADQPPPPAQ